MNTSSTYKGIRRYLNRGDFIGADFNRDGIFDHFAFIVEYDSSRQELLFAQHSTDYLRWENNTNWPANNGSLYVRVRAGEY